MAINGELILGRDSGLFEMDDAEILGFIKKVRVSFSYSPPEDGGRWEPSFDASISISTIEVVRTSVFMFQ